MALMTSAACTGAGGLAGFSAEQVEEVRMVVRMLPVFCATILFWTIYAQARPPSMILKHPHSLVPASVPLRCSGVPTMVERQYAEPLS